MSIFSEYFRPTLCPRCQHPEHVHFDGYGGLTKGCGVVLRSWQTRDDWERRVETPCGCDFTPEEVKANSDRLLRSEQAKAGATT